MAEYIERKTALDAISGWLMKALHTENMSSYNEGERAAYRTALSEIAELTTADARPVVRGQWEEDCAGAAVCSVCGEYAFETSTHHLCGWFPNYCPNCGADMREANDEKA